VEATAMLGKGHIHLTGQLGDVIKESSQIDLTWVYHANCKICRFKQLASLLFFMRKSV
jgi:ATP-dependent Lon protease